MTQPNCIQQQSIYKQIISLLSVVLILALVVSLFDKTKNHYTRASDGFDKADGINNDSENINSDNKNIQKRSHLPKGIVELSDDFNFLEENDDEFEDDEDSDLDYESDEDNADSENNAFNYEMSKQDIDNHKSDLIGNLLDRGAKDEEVMEVMKAVDQSLSDSKVLEVTKTTNPSKITQKVAKKLAKNAAIKITKHKRNFIKDKIDFVFNGPYPEKYFLHAKIRFNTENLKTGNFEIPIYSVYEGEIEYEKLSFKDVKGKISLVFKTHGNNREIDLDDEFLKKISDGQMHFVTLYVDSRLVKFHGAGA